MALVRGQWPGIATAQRGRSRGARLPHDRPKQRCCGPPRSCRWTLWPFSIVGVRAVGCSGVAVPLAGPLMCSERRCCSYISGSALDCR
eukprot:8007585-Alexandrium_andersonii.AAC.1